MAKIGKCSKHRDYKGIRRPTSGCPECIAYYNALNPDASLSVDFDLEKDAHRVALNKVTAKYREAVRRYDDLQKKLDGIAMLQAKCIPIKIRPVREHRDSSHAVAMLVASDWHTEENVDPRTVNGKNRFNLEIAKDRSVHFFRNGLRLTNMFGRDVKIDTITLALLGDFITNYLHDDNSETNNLPPAKALEFVKSLLASGIKFILENSKYNLVVPCCYGNHARMTQKKRSANLVGTSFEYALYKWLADLFSNEKRIQFDIAEGAHLYADILGLKVRFHHGDRIRYQGGVGGITIPLNKAINQWNKVEPVDVDVMGHWHQTLSGRNYIVNGSLIGWNAFANDIKADFEPPKQTFALIDRDRGLTFTGPIILTDVQRKIINSGR